MSKSKSTTTDSSALEALDRMLEELRREFAANPEFAARVVRALGAQVTFASEDAHKLLNPIELAARTEPDAALAELGSLSAADLKKIAKSTNLATASDLKGKSVDDLARLIDTRARKKIAERSS
ncbi:MAG: hypothetical protein RLN72_11545 [Henriciella sp.]